MSDPQKLDRLAKAREKAAQVRAQKKKRQLEALQEEIEEEIKPVCTPLAPPPDSDSDEEILSIVIKRKKKHKDLSQVINLANWAGNFGNTLV